MIIKRLVQSGKINISTIYELMETESLPPRRDRNRLPVSAEELIRNNKADRLNMPRRRD